MYSLTQEIAINEAFEKSKADKKLKIKNMTTQRLAHEIEFLAHEYNNGIVAADSLEKNNPKIAKEYRAAAHQAKAKQIKLKIELSKILKATGEGL